ncbi:MAG: CDP-diacylglycerol--glycerol-3-phosphate 3-phosphatidyltransferase [Acutalibacteraceae bacterium]|nr:CDP-diacylglycerol--glycerol-3-phosphate 3-phosphatidyltransferase [Oscillospiraceae bacterium]
MKNKRLNTPNRLTLVRIVLAPVFLILLISGVPHSYLFSFLIFAAASVTDFIDGKIARSTNQITALGKLLDPLADKMLITAALLGFMLSGECHIFTAFVILMREYTVTGVRMIALTDGIVIPANIFGKIKTALQMISIALILALNEWLYLGKTLPFDVKLLSNILLGLTAVIAVVSGIIYIFETAKKINFLENK